MFSFSACNIIWDYLKKRFYEYLRITRSFYIHNTASILTFRILICIMQCLLQFWHLIKSAHLKFSIGKMCSGKKVVNIRLISDGHQIQAIPILAIVKIRSVKLEWYIDKWVSYGIILYQPLNKMDLADKSFITTGIPVLHMPKFILITECSPSTCLACFYP